MGPVVAVIAIVGGLTVAASSITQAIADNLQQQVNNILNSHAQAQSKLKNLQSLLEKIDFSKIEKPLKKMNKILHDNLKIFIDDQNERIKLIKKITINKDSKQSSFWQNFSTIIGNIGTIVSTVSVIMATNPASAVIGLVGNIILSIFSIISNIKQIGHLKAQKRQLQQYFQTGGQFQQQQQTICSNSVQMVQNLYLMAINQNNTIKMLDARISLLSYQYPKQFDYNTYHQQLSNNPFTHLYAGKIFNMLAQMQNIAADPNLSLSRQISRMNHILTIIVNDQHITRKIKEVGSIFDTFQQDANILQSLQSQAALIGYLNTFRDSCLPYFQGRQSQTESQNQTFDPIQLQSMLTRANVQFPSSYSDSNKQQYIAEVVSFFTTTFYGDDQTGATLYGYNLAQLHKKTRLLNYISPIESAYNFILPQPTGHGQQQWLQKKNILMNKFMANFQMVAGTEPIFLNMYIRMTNFTNNFGGQAFSTIQIIYGISLQYHLSYKAEEMTFEEMYSALQNQNTGSQSFVNLSDSLDAKSVQFVNSPPAIQGISYVLDGTVASMLNAIDLISNGTEAQQNGVISNPKWSNLEINGQNFIDFSKNFNGLCINFRDLKVSQNQINTVAVSQDQKEDKIAVSSTEVLICNVLLNVAIAMKPKQILSIEIPMNTQQPSNVSVTWSPGKQQPCSLDGKLLNCVQSSVGDLNKIAAQLRAEKKELFIMNVVNQQKAFYWYLE